MSPTCIGFIRRLGLGLMAAALVAFPQQITHEVRVVNIEVPVRVFDGPLASRT